MLRWHDVFEELPLVDYDLRWMTELDESEQIGFLSLQPRIGLRDFLAALRKRLNLGRQLVDPISAFLFLKSLAD
jgi:hypothetical protein